MIILRQTLNDVHMGAAILKWTSHQDTTLSQWEKYIFIIFSLIVKFMKKNEKNMSRDIDHLVLMMQILVSLFTY